MITSEDQGPLDLEALSRLANGLFQGLSPDPEQQQIPGQGPPDPIPGDGSLRPPASAPSGGATLGAFEQPRFSALAPAAPDSGAAPNPGSGGGPVLPDSAPSVPTDNPWTAQGPSAVSPLSTSFGAAFSLGDPDPAELGLPDPADLGLPPAPSATGPAFYFLNHAPLEQPGISAPGLRSETPSTGPVRPPFDFNQVRRDFPILSERVNGRPLVWLDNAATTQKPRAVIDRLKRFYEHENSNVHRAAHTLAARSSDAYEEAREKVRGFLGASDAAEIVFVRGATEAINLVAQTWGRTNVGTGDEILVSHLEHHANIVPWQRLAEEKGAKLKVIPVDEDGQVLLDEAAKLLGPRTKLLAVTHVSNALGTIVPVQALAAMAHAAGAKVLIDGAQAVSHLRVDVRALDADFYVFSGHKVFAPTGIGVLYGKKALLDSMPPWQGGGNMIKDVSFERTEYHAAPGRFEAGTGNIADAIGLGAAIDYVTRLGIGTLGLYEHQLLEYATHKLTAVPGVRLVGTAREKASVLSFVLDGYKTEEVGSALAKEGIAVRSGHHCAQPILRRFGLESSVRPSLAFYNHCGDVDALVKVVRNLAAAKRPK
jgi:cysteine desulfurase/selenocysteine lyase